MQQHLLIDRAPGQGIACDCSEGFVFIRILEVDYENQELMIEIDVPPNVKIQVDGRWREWQAKPTCKGLPRFLLLFAYILCHKVRHDVFYPCFNEFLEDYVFARKKFRTKWARRWLTLAFSWRTACVIARCLWIQFGGWKKRLRQILLGLLSSLWR